MIKRLLFANSVLNEKIDQQLIVFSDESRFALKNDNGHIWYRLSENSDDVYQDKDNMVNLANLYLCKMGPPHIQVLIQNYFYRNVVLSSIFGPHSPYLNSIEHL